MSFLHEMKKGRRKYDRNLQTIVTTKAPKKIKHRNHYTPGKTGYVPHPCGNQVNIPVAKRGY